MRGGGAEARQAVGSTGQALGVDGHERRQRRQRQCGESEVVRLQAQDRTGDQCRRRRGGEWRGDHREVAERRYGKGRRVSTDAEQRALREVEGAELAEHELITQAQQRVDADQGHQALTEGWQDGERQHRRQDQQDEPEAAHQARRPSGSPKTPRGRRLSTARTTT